MDFNCANDIAKRLVWATDTRKVRSQHMRERSTRGNMDMGSTQGRSSPWEAVVRPQGGGDTCNAASTAPHSARQRESYSNTGKSAMQTYTKRPQFSPPYYSSGYTHIRAAGAGWLDGLGRVRSSRTAPSQRTRTRPTAGRGVSFVRVGRPPPLDALLGGVTRSTCLYACRGAA